MAAKGQATFVIQDDYDNEEASSGTAATPNAVQVPAAVAAPAAPAVTEGFVDEDEQNMEEIEKMLGSTGLDAGPVLDEEDEENMEDIDNMLDALHQDLDDSAIQSSGAAWNQSALPSQGGKLSAHAAEFWFPECRNCPCCTGYKHGCSCTKTKGVDTCVDPNCVNAEFVTDVQRSLSSSASSATIPPATKKSGAVLPAGAVPSQGGKLSAHAAEFWFPECRNCPCCNGFKHGCSCTKTKGVDTCIDPNCVNAEFVSDVQRSLNTPAAATTQRPTSGVPANTNAYKANTNQYAPQPDYWYPECQNCPCCGGYAHGCQCIHYYRVGACCHCKAGGVQGNQGVGPAPSSAPNFKMSRSYSAPNSRTSHVSGAESVEVCRFYMQGHCNFGSSCRYKHPQR